VVSYTFSFTCARPGSIELQALLRLEGSLPGWSCRLGVKRFQENCERIYGI